MNSGRHVGFGTNNQVQQVIIGPLLVIISHNHNSALYSLDSNLNRMFVFSVHLVMFAVFQLKFVDCL